MYYVWQHRMFQTIASVDNTIIEIIHPGLRNLDSGPDFFNAKIKLNGTVWAGNVEMHVKASDWFKHHHQEDKIYDSVILHVVLAADAEIHLHDGEVLKTAIMTIPKDVMNHFQNLTSSQRYSFSAINCKNELPLVPQIILHDWQTSLAIQRMMNKVNRVRDIIDDKQKSWQEALYVTLTRALGTGINSEACERLARSLPFSFIMKHADNYSQIEAFLLGQANLVDNIQIQKEYAFLRAKFSLTPLPKEVWKMSRTRPQASPTVRLRALARIIYFHNDLFSKIIDCQDIQSISKILTIPKMIGTSTVNSLIINSVIPIMLAYAQWQKDDGLNEKAIYLLESLPAESNRYMDYWIACGIPLKNALDSQAMLQLYKDYCEPHKCLRCRLGCWLLKNKRQ